MIHSANAGGHACSVVLTHQRSPLGDKRSLPISRRTPVSDALRQTTRIDARNEATATDRVNDVVRLVSRLLIAGLALTAAVSVILLARAANRGLDLTDEGIYLHAYRGWKFYDLSITGAGAVLGPVFQLLGWSIPALRLLKLVCLLASSAFLAFATTEFVHHHFKAQILRREKQALVVLISILSAFSVYAWLPQSPGYNDLSIMLSAVSIGLAFLWAISTGRRSTVFAVLIGVAIILLIFVKWPSAICTSAGITAFIIGSGRFKRFGSFLAASAAGGVATLAVLQIGVGHLLDRAKELSTSSDTALRGTGFMDAYVLTYARNISSTAAGVARVCGPVMVPVLILCAVLVRRRPVVATTIYTAGLGALTIFARKRGYITGGEINVVRLESTFPIFFTAALGLVVLWAVHQQGRPKAEPASTDADPTARFSLLSGVLLVSAAPLLQAIGTGNPMFRIAFCAGAAWATAVAAMMLVVVERGGRAFYLPATCALGTMSIVGLVAGLQGLRTDSFRVGPLSQETVALPGVPEMKGMRLDQTAADLIRDTREVLRKEGALGAPGFSTFNGTGLTYALGMPEPLGGLFVEEPLPNVLRSRIQQACKIGAITTKTPPVVLSLGSTQPPVATEELQKCGIDFPKSYKSVRVTATPGNYMFVRNEGLTVWVPKGP